MNDTGAASFLFTKRGIYYFSRRVPVDLRSHYKRPRLVLSLRTRSQRAARARAASLAAKLEEDWMTLRWRSSSDPFERFRTAPSTTIPPSSNAPLLSEARDLYVKAKGDGRPVTFEQAADRCVGYMVKLLGDRPIDTYTRSEINQLRDAFGKRGLSRASIRRNFGTIRAIANFAARELGEPEVSAFSGVYLGESEQVAEPKRQPIPGDVLAKVQAECRSMDDEPRWLIALVSDTGMRLSEAVGLLKSDVVLGGDHPHLVLKQHPWRRLKTRGSERLVPLVGSALWAARRAVGTSEGPFLFPRYCNEQKNKANSASGALNKWLSKRVPKGCVIHSFRHSLRDRLRAAECPKDIIDRLGGWTVGGIGETYGFGYPISVLHRWMEQIV